MYLVHHTMYFELINYIGHIHVATQQTDPKEESLCKHFLNQCNNIICFLADKCRYDTCIHKTDKSISTAYNLLRFNPKDWFQRKALIFQADHTLHVIPLCSVFFIYSWVYLFTSFLVMKFYFEKKMIIVLPSKFD